MPFSKEGTLSRRGFLKTAGGLTVAAVASSFLPACGISEDSMAAQVAKENAELIAKLEGWLGITAATTPEEYAKLAADGTLNDPSWMNSRVIGTIVCPDKANIDISTTEEGELEYRPNKPKIEYKQIALLAPPTTLLATQDNNSLVCVASNGGSGRLSKSTNMRAYTNFLKTYVPDTTPHTTLYLNFANSSQNAGDLGTIHYRI